MGELSRVLSGFHELVLAKELADLAVAKAQNHLRAKRIQTDKLLNRAYTLINLAMIRPLGYGLLGVGGFGMVWMVGSCRG